MSTTTTDTIASCSVQPIVTLTEEWRVIDGYEGRYEISNCGRVLSHGRNRTRPLRLNYKKHGIVAVTLQIDSVKTTFIVARLVAEYFIGEIPPDHWVFHLDGRRDNNRVDNLGVLPPVACINVMRQEGRHWSTTQKCTEHLRQLEQVRGERHGMAKITREIVKAIRDAKGTTREVGERFGLSQSHTSAIRRGRFWAM